MYFSEHHYRSDDSLKLHYRRYGRGDDVVICLPGMTRNCKDFEVLAEHLAERWRVLTPDLRGRGRSDWDPKPARYHPGTYARDVWKLADFEGVGRFAIIGTSLGGMIGMVMAFQDAGRLTGVVLNDIGPEIPPEAAARILQYVGRIPPAADWQAAAERVKRNYSVSFPGVSDEFWDRWVRLSYRENEGGQPVPDMDPAIGDSLRKAYRLAKWLRVLNRFGLLRRVHGIPFDPWESFRSVTMPCILIQGALSDVLTDDLARRMGDANPRMEWSSVPDRGHAPLLDEPVALAAIDQFLARLPRIRDE